MRAQDWMQAYDEEVTRAKGRHQQTLQEAHDAFKKACDEAEQQRNAIYFAACDAWDAVKDKPDHPNHDAGREAFKRAQVAASFVAARHALAEAIRKADEGLKAEVQRIAGKHRVIVQ
ncbi:MAG TPA: hypothetical protein VFR68_07870 [Candidatus Dormibacteraeota bacterium]|nr:hypothetical protein [Candidatus Dormibacteraeota bacterium]